MFKNRKRHIYASYARNFIFGVEDSLVSTIGLISGVASTGLSRGTIIITGIILIFVEAFSMGVGSLLSEHSAEEYERKNTSLSLREPLVAGIIMFFSYLFAGLIPMSPYFFLMPSSAFWISIIASLLALFGLGFLSGKVLKIKKLRTALEMLILGGAGVFVGVGVGYIVQNYFL